MLRFKNEASLKKMDKEIEKTGCSSTQESSLRLKSRINKTFKNYDYLKSETARLQTFIDWPLEWLKPSELAAAGFYYMRTKDHCACIFCAQIIGMWEKNDNPRQEHERHSPHCPFIRGQNVGNIAINPKNNICYTQDTDICGTPRLMAGSYPECGK